MPPFDRVRVLAYLEPIVIELFLYTQHNAICAHCEDRFSGGVVAVRRGFAELFIARLDGRVQETEVERVRSRHLSNATAQSEMPIEKQLIRWAATEVRIHTRWTDIEGR